MIKAKRPMKDYLNAMRNLKEKKKELKYICEGLNPAEKLQDKLIRLAGKKSKRFEYTLCEGYDK